MTIRHIFITGIACIAAFMLSGCSNSDAKTLLLPADIEAITEPFIIAVAKNDQIKAESMISSNAVDEAREQFDGAAEILAANSALKPKILLYKQRPFAGPDTNDATVFYYGEKGKLWTTMEIRLFRLQGEKYEVEYWNVARSETMPKQLSDQRKFKNYALYGSLALALGCLLLIMLIIWFVRRRNDVIAPVAPIDERPLARSISEEE